MERPGASHGKSASELISARVAELGDWRGATLARMRGLIHQAVPDVVEEWKWRGTPVWSHGGILCTGESYKSVVKLTFAKGASLEDPARLFNASLEGNMRRAIDIRQGEEVDGAAFKELVRRAVALNGSRKPGRSKPAKPGLLAGGNPQIPKADGDAPVQAYIAAMPGWKREVGRRLDALITGAVPEVRRAVKWNSPFYGLEGRGWILSFHCFTKYVKVTFFRGGSLRPLPPGVSKHEEVRTLDVHEGDPLDEKLMKDWIRQAARLPGWVP